ncbi:MAG: type II secretion system secretin GspD [bacterium]
MISRKYSSMLFSALLTGAILAPSTLVAQETEKNDGSVNPQEKYNLPANFDPDFRPKKTPGNVRVTIDFRQAQLDEVVKFFSGAMNKNFIISDSINTSKTITIMSPKEVSLNEAYRAFLAALQMNGLTIVPMGSFLKIVESKNAIVEPQTPYESGERIPNEARMVTAIVPIENAALDEIQPVIAKFLTQEATVIPYGSSLIITENGANLRRVQQLIEKLDKGDSANKIYVYRVLHADATEIETRIEEIFQAQKGGTAARSSAAKKKDSGDGGGELDVTITDIIADERTNQLIIVSDKKSFDRIKEMIEILDVPTAVGGQVHVKFLEYADADELASTLSGLAQGAQRNNTSSRRTSRAAATAATNSTAEAGSLLQGDVQINAYKPTNSLVVVASPRDFLALENVIDQLDRPRRQVYVEAIIMEIGLDTNRSLGLGFTAGFGQDFNSLIPDSAVQDGLIEDTRGLVIGRSNYNGLDSASGSAGVLGLLGPNVTIPGTSISLPAFALLLQATQTDNSVNILSTPAILTMDNEEAEIIVGERVPFLRSIGGTSASSLLGSLGGDANSAATSALAGLTGLGGLQNQIDYEDVGITLRITPQVNESDYVRLEVDQEVSDIKGAGGLGDGAPIRTKRNAKTVVLVKDQSTIVIGGLIRDVENETVNKVPFLGDIPLVGVLFKNTSTIKTKQNLVLMLTPYVIEDETDMQKIQQRKMEERRELLKLFGSRDLQYVKSINFQKKSGLLDRMKSTIGEAVQGERAREEALKAFDSEGPQYRVLGAEEAPTAAPESEPSDSPVTPDPTE